jgi:hypothetical protein
MCTNLKIIHASDMSLLQENQGELLLRNGFQAAGIHQFHSKQISRLVRGGTTNMN